MAELWFISDTHFFHDNMLKFKDDKGYLIRPFSSMWEMNETIRKNWNDLVAASDHIYHLGDVTFQYHRPFRELMHELKGVKRLVVGNHDKLKQDGLLSCFEKVMLWRGFKEFGFTCTHIPLERRFLRDGKVNVHGHLHQRVVGKPGYINVSVEQIAYAPIHIEDIVKMISEMELDIDVNK